jgi:hypothetical protein
MRFKERVVGIDMCNSMLSHKIFAQSGFVQNDMATLSNLQCGLSIAVLSQSIHKLMSQSAVQTNEQSWYEHMFYLKLPSKTFLIVRAISRDISINVKTSSYKVPVILVGF